MKCHECGYIIPEDSEFCQYCGVKLEDASINEQNTEDNVNAVCEEKSESNNDITFCEESDIEIDKEIYVNEHEEVQTEAITQEILTCDGAVQIKSETEEQEEESVEKNIAKKTDTIHKETSKEDVAVITPPLNKKTKKIRYCKICGGLIDSERKKCTSCGKQFFKFSKGIIKTIVTIMLFVLLVGLNIFQYIFFAQTNKEFAQSKTTISTQKNTILKQKEEIEKLNEDVNKYKGQVRKYILEYGQKARFMDDHIVIIGNSNNKYHKYDCEDLDTTYFYAYNTENAKAQGYRACSKCN